MKIPKTFRLCGQTVKIRFVSGKQLVQKADGETPTSTCGCYIHSTRTIFISRNLPEKEQFETLLHELFHFAHFQFLDTAQESFREDPEIFLGTRIENEKEGDFLLCGEEAMVLQLEYVFSDFLAQLRVF